VSVATRPAFVRTGPSRAMALAASLLLAACGGGDGGTDPISPPPAPPPPPPPPAEAKSLRQLAGALSRPIGVGTAVGSLFYANDANGTQYRAILAREFDVVVSENDMKFSSVQPTRGNFVFTRADALVAFAEANGMRVRGHTLVWHQQLPAWLTSGTWTPEQADELLASHVNTVAGRYAGKVVAWDVVNEVFNDGQALPRQSFWMTNLGRGYVERAFRLADAADPGAALFYNDYNIEAVNAKSDSVYNMLADFKARGVPVDGVGMQFHMIAGALPTLASMQQNFDRFAALGLRIHITELDVRVTTPATATSLATQATNYRTIYQLCMGTPACEMAVTWGFTDRESWIPTTFPGTGDALLFDASFGRKPAYDAVHALLSGN